MKIQSLTQQSRYCWSCIYDGQQYYIQLDDCSSKASVYIYNNVVGGYQSADAIISEQIVTQLDLDSMQEQDWIEEGEEPQEEEDDVLEQC